MNNMYKGASVVARIMDGKEVTHYLLSQSVNGQPHRLKVTRDLFIYLIGRGDIEGYAAQPYNGTLVIRSKSGKNLTELPIVNNSGTTKNMEALGKIKKGMSAEDAVYKLSIIATIVDQADARKVIGYVVSDISGKKYNYSKDQVFEACRAGKIVNAQVQYNGDTKIVKGKDGTKISELPKVTLAMAGLM